MARYAYALPNKVSEEKITPRHKGDMQITEGDGEVTIELKNFTIVIKSK